VTEARFTTSDGLSLVFSDEGSGLPLLCLPGLTRNGSDFDDLAAALGGRHRLIRLTLRGRGGSDRDPDPMNYNIAVEARDVVEFLDRLGLARVVVVGTSRGGLIAMLLAAKARERLAGVLLNDIGPELAPEGLANIMSYLGVAPRAKNFVDVAGALRARMGAAFPGLADARWEVLARRWFDQGPDGLLLNYDPRLRDVLEAAEGQPAVDMWPLFDALAGVPLAVVRGANSDLLTPETLARMRERRPDMIVAEVPDRGHVPFLDEPEAIGALEALLARVEA
jgi:pimeloyl-ACP methyl ester carboxylesterase